MLPGIGELSYDDKPCKWVWGVLDDDHDNDIPENSHDHDDDDVNDGT